MDDSKMYNVSLEFEVCASSPLEAAQIFLDVLFKDQPALFYNVEDTDTEEVHSLELCTTGNPLKPGGNPNSDQEIRKY